MRAAILLLVATLHASGFASEAEPSPPFQSEPTRVAPTIDWHARVAAVKPGPDDLLYVVAHSAVDCPYCKEWKKSKAGLGVAKIIVNGRPMVRLAVVERESLKGREEASDYPAELRFDYQRRLERNQLRPPVPAFDLFLGKTLVFRATGLSTWNSDVVPAILQIEKRREEASAGQPAEPAK